MALSQRAAVMFDLWNTLIFEPGNLENSELRREIRANYIVQTLDEHGETVDRGEIFRVFVELSDEMTAGHNDGLDRHFGEWVNLGLARIDSELPGRIGIVGLAEVGAAIDRSFIDCPPELLDGSLDVLDQIGELGLEIALITNTGLTSGGAFRDWFADIGLLSRLKHTSYSNEMALAKPDRQMWDAATRSLGVESERVLHVGDNLHTDVAGAAAIGMSTVWASGAAITTSNKSVEPDYTVETILELLPSVDNWLETLDS
jgi:FMN phosphatase YigB (HAD superfamily)